MRARITLAAAMTLAVCIMPAGSARADIESGLAGYWPLDDNAVDATGDGHDGTIKGCVTCAADRFGYCYYALHFPGQSQAYIDLGQPPGLLVHHAMTVAAWVRAENLNQAGQIIAKRESIDDRSWSLELAAGGIARFEIAADRTTRIQADSQPLTFGPTEWFHVAGVLRPGEAVELWLNGRLAATQPTTITSHYVHNDESIRIGGGAGSPWQGDIDEVRLYARALSPADMNELFAFVSSIPTTHLKAWDPQPRDGAIGVMYSFLTWKRGVTGFVSNLYIGTDPNLKDAIPLGGCLFGFALLEPGLEPGVTYYWRVDEVEADGKMIHTGDVWHFTAMPYTAFDPWPADGARETSIDAGLSWSPGRDAVSHQVYLGTDPNALTKGSGGVYRGDPTHTRFDPGRLQVGTTYYWRVDEVGKSEPNGSARTWVGRVWSFTTANFPVVDDFESYDGDYFAFDTNEDDAHAPLHETWYNTWALPFVCDFGYCPVPPYVERTIVHGGRQSMAFDYNNAPVPYYTEFERELVPFADWTLNGADTLVLYVRGRAVNDPTPLYVEVQDSAGRVCVAAYPDPQVLAATQWVQWKIPLSQFTSHSLNMKRIKKMYIGVGDRNNPTPGGLGRIYIDDIRIAKSGQEESF